MKLRIKVSVKVCMKLCINLSLHGSLHICKVTQTMHENTEVSIEAHKKLMFIIRIIMCSQNKIQLEILVTQNFQFQ